MLQKRVSYEQREKMLAFMLGHENFAKGRVSGPDRCSLEAYADARIGQRAKRVGVWPYQTVNTQIQKCMLTKIT